MNISLHDNLYEKPDQCNDLFDYNI